MKIYEDFEMMSYEYSIHRTHHILIDHSLIHSLHSNLSSCYLHLNQCTKALEEAEMCISLKPLWAKGFFRKGMVYFQQEQYIDAAEAFYHGCELDPKDKRLAEMVGVVGRDY